MKPTGATPRWLTDEEQAAWRAYRAAARLLFAQLERDLSRDASVAPGLYELLVILSESPHHAVRMNDLADATMSSPSRISHAVERLVQRGWAERHTCPSDRRGWLAVLTDAGMRAIETAAPLHVEHLRTHLFDGLDDRDLRDLRRISEKLLARLPATRPPADGRC
ncbi:MAG: MarR family winged helix-turn-helix transcriptional regulator [Candidatus Dormibacteria bacterium]